MELPNQLKNLYKHWPLHIGKGNLPIPTTDLFKEVSVFINERIKIWQRKTKGENPPYTKDNILSTYRFCNIFREFDKQTITFHTLLKPLEKDFPLWLLNMFYCRMVARPETIEKTGLLSFNEKENRKVYEKLKSLERPIYGTPYVFPISVILKSKTPTRELFLTKYLPEIVPRIAEEIQTWKKMSVYDGVEKVLPIFGYNFSFLWTEVLIDVAYQYPECIDLFKRFPIGPGSAPTMKRIDSNVDTTLLVERLAKIQFDTDITYNNKPLRLSAENWEGIGCEFRKYTNLKAGSGRKRIYRSS